MADFRAELGKPFAGQVAALRLRLGNLVPTTAWDDLQRNQHDSAFMVAGAMKVDLLADILAALQRAAAEGTGLEQFRKDWAAAVERHDWHGWTGETTAKGRAWRTRVVYQANMSVSYAAGRLAQLRDGNFPLWVYLHGGSREPRIDHLSWHGWAGPPDHPFWLTHYAPNGWGCTCRVRGARSAAGVRRLGGDPDKTLPDNWAMIDPKTGAQIGIDKGWDYMPGATVADTIRKMTEKAVNWDYSLSTAFMKDLPDSTRDAFSRGYRDTPSLAVEMRRWSERVMGERNGAPIDPKVVVAPQKSLGLATSAQKAEVAGLLQQDLGRDLYDFTIDTDAVRHIMESHTNEAIERSRGQRVLHPDDFGRLGALINAPDKVETADTVSGRGPRLRFEKRFDDGTLIALFELRRGRRRLSLVTMWVEV